MPYRMTWSISFLQVLMGLGVMPEMAAFFVLKQGFTVEHGDKLGNWNQSPYYSA